MNIHEFRSEPASAAVYAYEPETIQACRKISADVVDGKAHRFGMQNAEPLIVMLDGFLKYAKAYQVRYLEPLSTDRELGKYWLESIVHFKRLFDGDGEIATRCGITTDTKSNGACENMYWNAIKAAGFTQEDINNAGYTLNDFEKMDTPTAKPAPVPEPEPDKAPERFRCFTRTFWRRNSKWPNGKEPHPGRKHYKGHPKNLTEDAARAYCKQWNANHEPGPMSLKCEFESY